VDPSYFDTIKESELFLEHKAVIVGKDKLHNILVVEAFSEFAQSKGEGDNRLSTNILSVKAKSYYILIMRQPTRDNSD
jgi:hypothetical protein